MLDRILTGPLARGAFGYAIATVGDVNLDGFTGMRISRHRAPRRLIFLLDIVIGAPFADDPTVYLYTTSLKGLVASPLQVRNTPSWIFFWSHTFFWGGGRSFHRRV